MIRHNSLRHCNNRKQRKPLQCMSLVWRPTDRPVQLVSAPPRAASRSATYTVPQTVFAFSLGVLGSFFYTAGIWIKNVWHQWMTYFLVVFFLSLFQRSMCVLIWNDTEKFIIYIEVIFFCLYLIHFSCVCIYTWIQCPYTIRKGKFYVSMFPSRVAICWGWITCRSLELATLPYHVNRSPLENYMFFMFDFFSSFF